MKLILLLLGVVFGVGCWSQQYNFKNYSVQQGLAQSQVKVIQQDSMGYLWVGTQSGLSRFDGISFTNYSVDNGLPDNHIEGICVDEKGQVWVGTPEGIAKFDGNIENSTMSVLGNHFTIMMKTTFPSNFPNLGLWIQ